MTIERCQFSSLGLTSRATQSCINISANNEDYLEISNNFIHGNSHGGIFIHANSSDVRGFLINNVITSNVNGTDVVLVRGLHGSRASFLVAGNYLKTNDPRYPGDLISMENVWATIKNNTIFDNTARYIVNWEGGDYTNQTTGNCLNNMFYLNNAHLHTTVLAKGTGKVFRHNLFANPANNYEISTLPSQNTSTAINAADNWWENTDDAQISRRIKDRRSSPLLPVVNYKPYLLRRDSFYQGNKN